jgi:seryl-tRNA synthetase
MIDIQQLIKDPEGFQENCKVRGVDVSIKELIETYHQRNKLIQQNQFLKEKQNEISSRMKQKDLSSQERESCIAQGRDLKIQINEGQLEEEKLQQQFQLYLLRLPNLTHPQTPKGGENDFRVLRLWSEPKVFDFKPLDHLQLAQKHDLVDFEMGTKTSGQKFYFLKNEAVFLELALIRYVLDLATKHRFKVMSTPDVAKNSILEGIGFAPRGPESQVYRLEDHDLSLIATAEITIGGAYENHIFNKDELPALICGLSHCFRTEAGSHGRESKGLYRVHQFSKVELFAFCCHEQSEEIHEKILLIEEEVFQGLEIPYRVIEIASGDLGAPAYRKFDIEAWMPGRGYEGSYGEVTSTSNCLDFQSRRLKIRYRQPDGRLDYVHTLNGTAIAISRAIVAILENGQQADGTILMPKALHPYLSFQQI